MSDHIVRVQATSIPIRAAMPWLVGAAIYALLLLMAPKLLNDPDTYWHVATGRWIFTHGTVPHIDPFSFTMRGEPWTAFEWLSELIYAGVFALAGWPGVAVVAAAAVALTFGLLTHFILRALAPVWTLIFLLAAFTLTAPHILARPHALVMPVMVAWTAALVSTMDRRTAPPYWALPLLTLWANLHGSVIVGVGLIGFAALESLVNAEDRREWPRVIRRWLPFGLLALIAACLTPYGLDSLLMPLKTLALGDALNIIDEWRPQDFSRIGVFEILLLLGIFALSRGFTLPWTRALAVLVLLHLALAHSRNADLLALLAPLFLAQPLAHRLGECDDVNPGTAGTARGIRLLVIAAAAIATTISMMRPVNPNPRISPSAAIAAADLAHAGPVLNDYVFGGYMIFKGIPPFIDGRGEIYGAKFLTQYNRALSLSDLPGFMNLLDRHDIRATLLSPGTPAIALLDRLPGWKRVYADGVAVVHARRGEAAPN